MKREAMVEFFLLTAPTISAAAGLGLIKSVGTFKPNECLLLSIGFAVSFIVALLSIKFMPGFIKNHNFISFGVYRIILTPLFLFIFKLHLPATEVF